MWQRRSEVDWRGAMASESVRLPPIPLAVAGFVIRKSRRSGGEAGTPPQPQPQPHRHSSLLRDGAVGEQRRREPGPVDWDRSMPLQLAAATVPGGRATAAAQQA